MKLVEIIQASSGSDHNMITGIVEVINLLGVGVACHDGTHVRDGQGSEAKRCSERERCGGGFGG